MDLCIEERNVLFKERLEKFFNKFVCEDKSYYNNKKNIKINNKTLT